MKTLLLRWFSRILEMSKLIYLFELDSARTSPEEIVRGQQALFREIVMNENQVVLTFNQLTDSLAFLCAISNPAIYPHMLELFRLGALKVSRFAPPHLGGEFADTPKRVLRTASHYVQNAVERCLNDSNDSFLFSALPFQSQDKKLLTVLSYSLQYSDPSVLDAYWKTFRFPDDGFEGEQQAQKRRDYVKRYVEMILQLSKEPLAANPEKIGEKTSFSDVLELILHFCADPPSDDGDEVTKLLPQAHALLATLRQTVFGPNHSINNRSNWYDELIRMGPEPPVLLAEAVVDLCYNYTMEASISGIDRCLDDASFREDFFRRLRLYWNDGKQGIHQFQKGDLRTLTAPETQKLPPWGAGLRLIRATAPKGNAATALGKATARPKGQRGWYFRIGCSLLKQLWTATIYFALFLGTSYSLDLMEGWLSAQGAQVQLSGLLSLLSIVLFGLLGSLVSIMFGLPDILENMKAFATTAYDGVQLLLFPRHTVHFKGKRGSL